jgi:hypothetical protein
MMRLYSTDDTPIMEINQVERRGKDLLIKGKVFGTMPMTARLSPDEARNGLKLLNLKLVLFMLTFLFR